MFDVKQFKNMEKNYLTQWRDADSKEVKKAIFKYFKSRPFYSLKSGKSEVFSLLKSFAECDSKIGLAYTSNSSVAGLWVCSDRVYLDVDKKYSLRGFIMDIQERIYALYCDDEENELIIPIH